MSQVELQMNQVIWIMFIFVNIISLVSALLEFQFRTTYGLKAEYLQVQPEGLARVIKSYATWMLLTSTFIPVSLVVTVECAKIVQGYFIANDIEMTHIDYDKDGMPVHY